MVEVTGPHDEERSFVPAGAPGSPWTNEEHAWHAGLLLGAFMRIGLPVTPVMDELGYTNEMLLQLPEIPTTNGQPVTVRIAVLPRGER